MWPLIDQLVCQGVTDFFLAPGSRSTPLAISAARHPLVQLHRHFDERALGFYALGHALAQEKPVAVIVTSGTAVGNLLPAVMEAHHACVPLIVLTADRPSELQGCSANQTTDQVHIFQKFVRGNFAFEPGMPEKTIRSQAAHAVLKCKTGPVHVNCALREPLYPVAIGQRGKPIELRDAVAHAQPLRAPSRGLILLGRLPRRSDVTQVLNLAEQLGYPVVADVLSNARLEHRANEIRNYDWFSGLPKVDAVFHFGERMTSKRLMEWLQKQPFDEYTHISPHEHWNDPHQLVTRRVVSDVNTVCITNTVDPEWLLAWQTLDRETKLELDAVFTDAPFTESSAIRLLSELKDHAIFLGNSMPIREANWFLFPQNAHGFFCNRGLSGIDGNLATAVGVAQGLQKPLVAVLGDLTTLHDLNSFALLQKTKVSVKLIVSNNDGGGIFSHLAVKEDRDFEKLFGFEHGLNFKHVAEMFSIPYARAQTNAELEKAIRETDKCVIEMITSRKHNALFHERLKQREKVHC